MHFHDGVIAYLYNVGVLSTGKPAHCYFEPTEVPIGTQPAM